MHCIYLTADMNVVTLTTLWLVSSRSTHRPFCFHMDKCTAIRSTVIMNSSPNSKVTGRHQCRCIVPKAVYTVKKCSGGWASLSPETCTAYSNRSIKISINGICCIMLVAYIVATKSISFFLQILFFIFTWKAIFWKVSFHFYKKNTVLLKKRPAKIQIKSQGLDLWEDCDSDWSSSTQPHCGHIVLKIWQSERWADTTVSVLWQSFILINGTGPTRIFLFLRSVCRVKTRVNWRPCLPVCLSVCISVP